MSLLAAFKKAIPVLEKSQHKGQLGKIGIIGGSLEYTGAPFYAGISAQRVGADLVSIICCEEAGIPIKCYSPELIVYPIIHLSNVERGSDEYNSICQRNIARVRPLLSRFDSVVIGPGAGRDPIMLETIRSIVTEAITLNKPIVIDGDGLFALTENPSLIKANGSILLTPNAMEFCRLWNRVMEEDLSPNQLTYSAHPFAAQELAKALHVTILQKGSIDCIANADSLYTNDLEGCLRRCGGQGDAVSGIVGVLSLWCHRSYENHLIDIDPCILAAWGASHIIRRAASVAFSKHQRGLSTQNIIEEIPEIVDSLCTLFSVCW